MESQKTFFSSCFGVVSSLVASYAVSESFSWDVDLSHRFAFVSCVFVVLESSLPYSLLVISDTGLRSILSCMETPSLPASLLKGLSFLQHLHDGDNQLATGAWGLCCHAYFIPLGCYYLLATMTQ